MDSSRKDPNDSGSCRSKNCCTCGLIKPLAEFYSKGTRTDSTCKSCQKEKKKAKYVVDKKEDVIAGLQIILTLTTQGLEKRIHAEIEKLDEVILCLQKTRQ